MGRTAESCADARAGRRRKRDRSRTARLRTRLHPKRSCMTTSATSAGTARYAKRFSSIAAPAHFREAQKLNVSSLGIGTYLGQPDDKIDASYLASVVAAV